MKAILLQGMTFGDESKGATIDSLCRKFPVDQIIRYGGGPQCAHNVITPEGFHHTFSQFGSGMLANPTLRTHLSRFMLVNPLNLLREAQHLQLGTPNPLSRITIDPRCVIITPWHVRLNRLREISRGAARHGSCGVGVGTAREYHLKYGDEDTLLVSDLTSYESTFSKAAKIWMRLTNEITSLLLSTKEVPETLDIGEYCHSLVEAAKNFRIATLEPSEFMVFEGAQGVMLDEIHGFPPHNTWTNCTFENADILLDEANVFDRTRIGCFRSYFTRHGYGPFPTEDASFQFPEPHNGTGKFQGGFRQGRFDFDLAKKAIEIVGGVDFLSISHLDCGDEIENINTVQKITEDTRTPIGVWSFGPTYKDRDFSCDLVDKLMGVLV